MKCDRAQEWFSSLIDGSIRPAEKVVLEAHLTTCRSCAADVERLRTMWHALDAMPQLDPPTTLRATVWQRIEAAGSQAAAAAEPAPRFVVRSPRLMWIRSLALGAAVVLLAALATVSVPGKYRTAAFSSLFGHLAGPQRNTPIVEATLVRSAEASSVVDITIALSGQSHDVASAVAELITGSEVITSQEVPLRSGRGQTSIAAPAVGSAELSVRVVWRDPNGAERSLVSPVRIR